MVGGVSRKADLVVVVNGFPRLSETFVLQELLELERQGVRIHLIALRRPENAVQQEAVLRLQAEVVYLPDLLDRAPRALVRLAHAALFLRRRLSYLNAVADVLASPDFTAASFRRSVVLAHRIVRLGSPAVYVHFAHKPATIGRFAALLAGVPYALFAHAKDIWLTPREELVRKLRDAEVVLTCTSEGQAYLDELAGGHTPVKLAYHGVDTSQAERAAGPAGDVPTVLSVGRLVEKKGHAILLRAASCLQERGVDFRVRIAGEGPEWATLQRLANQLGIGEKVAFLGPLTESEVGFEYSRADVFALACQQLTNGDRDGIPNVILEAMAHGLPVVSTTIGGMTEAVVDGECGLLAPQDDPAAIAERLAALLDDESLRARLGGAARARAVERFDRSRNLPAVVDALRLAGVVQPPAVQEPLGKQVDKLRAVA